MASTWQIRLKAADGSLAAIVDAYAGFAFTRRVNNRGSFALRLSAAASASALFELDSQVEFWRRDVDAGIAWYVEFEGLHRDEHRYFTDDDAYIYESLGVGYADLLARAIVNAAAGSAEAAKSGAAETIAKAFVSEQLVDRLAFSGFTVEADGAAGPTISKACAYRNLLEVVQEIAAVGGGDFAVVGTGAGAFEFRWYDGQLGTDRRDTVIFALERGNMRRADLRVVRSDEVNVVIVGGQGQGADRVITTATDAGRVAASPWNRREVFAPMTNTDDTDVYATTADEGLEAGRPKRTLTFEVLQTPGCVYGRDYFLGDIVTVRFAGEDAAKKLVAVTVSANDSGESMSFEAEDIAEDGS